MSVTDTLTAALAEIPNARIAVAVSGGGDSTALLHAMSRCHADLRAVTIDHGLRNASAHEAALVAALCRELGVPHTTLEWQNWNGTGNLQDAARNARLSLIGDWANAEGITHIALGHTLDDQAETVLLRLARGSGVDGLSGMAASRTDGPLTWFRPLLTTRREALRAYLKAEKITWIEDPSNDDPRFDRVKARQALALLAPLGITTEGLADTATRLQDARAALEFQTHALAKTCITLTDCGEVKIAHETFDQAPREVQHRLLAAALMWVSGQTYRPRFAPLRALLSLPQDQTLHGCTVRHRKNATVIRREPARVEGCRPITDVPWDGRWRVTKATSDTAPLIGPLGESGLRICKNWRETGRAREALLTSPAIWSNGQLIAAPLAGFANGWEIILENNEKGFFDTLMTR